jgi:fatty acid desaturase
MLRSPKVAWPSLFVLVLAFASSVCAIVLGASRAIPPALSVVLGTFGAYAAFTPLHEAAHRSIARARWVNEVVGRLAGVLLVAPFSAARLFHLEHHKHTNDPDADPDHYSGRGARWALPLRWLTQDLHYYRLYVGRFRSRPISERIEVLATLGAFVLAYVLLAARGYGREALLFWVLPARFAIGVLAFAFDWLPHRPHVITSKVDRLRATHAREGIVRYVVLFGQSMHLVHHLYPGVPFYQYGKVWRAKVRAMLQEAESHTRTPG